MLFQGALNGGPRIGHERVRNWYDVANGPKLANVVSMYIYIYAT